MKVTSYVHVVKDGAYLVLAPGDEIPEGVEVTNPDVLEDSESKDKAADKADESDDDKADEDGDEAAKAPRRRAHKAD